MCWTSDKIPTRNIATEDIVCFKVFDKQDVVFKTRKFLGIPFGKKIKYLISLWRKYTYIPYKANPKINLICVENNIIFGYAALKINEGFNPITWCINAGYHSYKTLRITKKHNESYHYVVKCIIPKGSIYYINDDYIVSSDIIVTDKIVK